MMLRDVVVIVDDSVESLHFLTDALEEAGYTVLVSLNGNAALDLIDRVIPDIVLMDAVMPGIDGFETCRRLKGNATCIDLPVIFMTGLSETEHIIEGFKAGGVDYVTKPVVPEELLSRMRHHLATARSARNARMALDLTGRFLIAVNREGRAVWSTPQAMRLLKEIFGIGDIADFVVPGEPFHRLRAMSAPDAASVDLSIAGKVLQFSHVGGVSKNEILLRLTVNDGKSDQIILREAFHLTEREAEVLLWVAAGKPNRDIAEILGLSHRTINKYLDQVYAKIGVENRSSATAKALRRLSKE